MDSAIKGFDSTLRPAPLDKGHSRDALRLRKACQGFESIFIHEMLKSMRKTIPESGLMDSGLRGKIYESMYDEALSKTLAERGALGIGDLLYEQLAPYALKEGGK